MEAVKQQGVVAASASGQKMQTSKPRLILMGVIAFTVFYVVWGIVKVIL